MQKFQLPDSCCENQWVTELAQFDLETEFTQGSPEKQNPWDIYIKRFILRNWPPQLWRLGESKILGHGGWGTGDS